MLRTTEDEARAAVSKLFSDTGVSKEETMVALQEIMGDIGIMIEAIENEIREESQFSKDMMAIMSDRPYNGDTGPK